MLRVLRRGKEKVINYKIFNQAREISLLFDLLFDTVPIVNKNVLYNLKCVKRAGLMLTTLATIKRMDGAFRVAYATLLSIPSHY